MTKDKKCTECNGTGSTYKMNKADNMDIDEEICESCDGVGHVEKDKTNWLMKILKEYEDTFGCNEQTNTIEGYHSAIMTKIKQEHKQLTDEIKELHTVISADKNTIVGHVRDVNNLSAQRDKYKVALLSISKNTCCESCQEAKLVASEALTQGDKDE